MPALQPRGGATVPATRVSMASRMPALTRLEPRRSHLTVLRPTSSVRSRHCFSTTFSLKWWRVNWVHSSSWTVGAPGHRIVNGDPGRPGGGPRVELAKSRQLDGVGRSVDVARNARTPPNALTAGAYAPDCQKAHWGAWPGARKRRTAVCQPASSSLVRRPAVATDRWPTSGRA
jgi:hypothetical protein